MADPHAEAIKVAAMLRDRIISGDLRAGGPLPAVSALADEYGVSRRSATWAIGSLVVQGLISMGPRGYRVPPKFSYRMPS
jgi:GntR family transcriptional regulator